MCLIFLFLLTFINEGLKITKAIMLKSAHKAQASEKKQVKPKSLPQAKKHRGLRELKKHLMVMPPPSNSRA